MTEETTTTTSGVQDLIARIRDDGVKAGREEAGQLIEEATRKATEIIEAAQSEAAVMRDKARADIESDRAAALEALQLAARDTGLELEAAVINAFERQVSRLVSSATLQPDFLQALVLVLAGRSADEYIKDKRVQLLVSSAVFGEGNEPELADRARRQTLGLASDMLREGVELVPSDDVQGGVRVRMVDDHLDIDLTSEAISRLLLKNLLPRFRALLSGAE